MMIRRTGVAAAGSRWSSSSWRLLVGCVVVVIVVSSSGRRIPELVQSAQLQQSRRQVVGGANGAAVGLFALHQVVNQVLAGLAPRKPAGLAVRGAPAAVADVEHQVLDALADLPVSPRQVVARAAARVRNQHLHTHGRDKGASQQTHEIM